jgi:Spy/CpxP family protein refolding chaperone
MSSHAKKWIGGTVLLLLLLCITPLIIGWKMKCIATSMQMKMPTTGVSIYQELQLTDVQKKQIDELDKEYQKRMVTFCQSHCASRMKVSKLLQSSPSDSQTLKSAQREVLDAYSSSEEATLQHILQVSEVLTPKQKEIFLKKIGDQIQVTCPMQFVR